MLLNYCLGMRRLYDEHRLDSRDPGIIQDDFGILIEPCVSKVTKVVEYLYSVDSRTPRSIRLGDSTTFWSPTACISPQ